VPRTGTGKGSIVHGIARLRLVGTQPLDGIEECQQDDFPKPLPFPSCVRNLPRRASGHGAMEALDRVSYSLDRLRRELENDDRHGGPDDTPRAA